MTAHRQHRRPARRPPKPYGGGVATAPATAALRAYSSADEVVVTCNDYPMLWKKAGSEPDRRRRAAASTIKAYPFCRFSPFTPDEVSRSTFPGYQYRLTAPPPVPLYEPPRPPGAARPGAPVLVVSGEMDDVTTPTEGRDVVAEFPTGPGLSS